MQEKLLLIDGHSIINRAFYGVPDLTNSEGVHTGAIFGFLNIIIKMINDEKPDYFAVAFDTSAPTFRHKKYPEYKGNRKPMPEELKSQVPLMISLLKDMDVPVLMMEGIEADDILGTTARKWEEKGYQVSIVSGDRDLLQLVTDSTKLLLPRTSKGETTVSSFYPGDVLEEYSVEPKGIIDLKALMGDASDNIPGVPKIGEKTAKALISEYKTIENLHEHLDEVDKKSIKESLKENFHLAELSKDLATIDTDADITLPEEDARFTGLFTEKAYETCKRLELRSFLSRFGDMSEKDSATEKEQFEEITDFSEVESFFSYLENEKILGFCADIDKTAGEIRGIAFRTEEKAALIPVNGFITSGYLISHIEELLKKGIKVFTVRTKELYRYILSDYEPELIDTEIMEYLLDPLRNDYGIPEDIREAAALSCKKGPEFLSRIQEYGMEKLLLETELPLAYSLSQMEKEGIRVKTDDLKAYSEALGEKISVLEKKIYEGAGETFNINSPKQLGVILFEKMGIPGGKKTKTGYSTSADVLSKLSADHPFVRDILEYRTYSKLKATYADGLPPFIGEDGRIHSSFNQTVTATGRISSADPNLQNIPVRTEAGRAFRKVFIPKEGYSFIDADYSQIELRILASLSGDEKLIEAYKDGKDIHAITASQVFNVPLDEVTSEMRRNAKAVNFGIIYGISSFGLSQDLSISRNEAKDYIDRYFEAYPVVKKYLDDLIINAREKGYAQTLFGRRRPVPELKNSNFMQRSFGERVAMNAPIQGTAADIIKIAMVNVTRALKNKGLKSRLILQVHDELLIETAPGEESAVRKILTEEMTGAASLPVPLTVDINEGTNWDEAH